MKNFSKLFRTMVFTLLFTGFTAGLSAEIVVGVGGSYSSMLAVSSYPVTPSAGIGIGGNISVDYLLLNGHLGVGAEIGFESVSFETATVSSFLDGGTLTDNSLAIPILLRVGYHVFPATSKFDLYLVGKIGYAFGIWSGDLRDYAEKQGAEFDPVGGLAFGGDLGVAYYFTPNIGVFLEGGYDAYLLETAFQGEDGDYTFEMPFLKWATLGVSLKF